MMYDSLNGLLEEYCESLKGVRHLKYKAQKRQKKLDVSLLGGMESDIEWTIEYIATGYMPAYSEGSYKKVVPVDPQEVLVYFSQSLYKSWPEENESEMKYRLRIVMNEVLTEKEQDAIKMVLGEGLSYGKAGKYLGMSKSAVQDAVRRAVRKIKRCF